jgi:hypothetical protein
MGQQQNGELQRDQRYRGDTKFHRFIGKLPPKTVLPSGQGHGVGGGFGTKEG